MLTVHELKNLCKERGITGYNRLDRENLIRLCLERVEESSDSSEEPSSDNIQIIIQLTLKFTDIDTKQIKDYISLNIIRSPFTKLKSLKIVNKGGDTEIYFKIILENENPYKIIHESFDVMNRVYEEFSCIIKLDIDICINNDKHYTKKFRRGKFRN